MRHLKLVLLLFLPVSFVVPGQIGDAPRVVIRLRTGEERHGEILSVRDQAVVFSSEYGMTQNQLRKKMDLLTVVKTNDIRLVTLEGKSHVLGGMTIGGLLGCMAGYLIGSSQPVSEESQDIGLGECERINKGAEGCMVGGGAGLAAGGILGVALSTEDSVITGHAAQDVNRLRELARYPGEEPEFLKAIH